jgi:hypothetical protein
MPKNKTIYVRDGDDELWEEGKRMLAFYQHKSLSVFLTEKIREYVKEENARQASVIATKGSDHA